MVKPFNLKFALGLFVGGVLFGVGSIYLGY